MFLKLSKFFLYASVFSVVVVMPSTFFPFIGGKYYFFRTAIELALISLMLWWAFEAKEEELEKRFAKISDKPIFLAVSAFALAFLLACVFANDSMAAFWSNYERGEGGFQMLHYYAFFVLLLLVFENRREWKWLFRCSLVAAGAMILYGMAAALNVPNFIGPYTGMAGGALSKIFSNSRFQGSLGNPAYVAPYLLFSIFYVFYLWASRTVASKWPMRIGYGAAVVFFFVFFVLSQTRGGFLGLVAGAAAFLAYVIFSAERKIRKWAGVGLLACAIAGGIMFAFRSELIAKNIPGSRLLAISITEQTAQTRFWTWGSAWQGFKERPFLGWGPENFSTVFDKYFDSRHFIPGQQTETWFDRAHSVVFDYLAETGLIGFLSYLSMFAALYYQFFRRRNGEQKMQSDPRGRLPAETMAPARQSSILKGLLFALPVAYFVQAILLFDVLPVYLNLFIFFAFALFELSHIHARQS